MSRKWGGRVRVRICIGFAKTVLRGKAPAPASVKERHKVYPAQESGPSLLDRTEFLTKPEFLLFEVTFPQSAASE